MDKSKINHSQLFCLMVLFELGSAVVVGVGIEAKQDAWLTILLGMLGGMALYTMYVFLLKLYPGLSLAAAIPKILGKPLGIPVSFAYLIYFLYIASRVLRDFGELLATSTLESTPLIAINLLMMSVVMYAVYRGIEGIGRTGEPIFFVMILSLFMGMFFLVLSGRVHPENLLPMLEKGVQPVIKTVATQTYTFPFGEIIVFTMVLPMLNRQESALRTGLYAIIFAGIVLTLTIICDIVVLGVRQASVSQFPLLETFSKVNIGKFIQRLDILVISMLILGMFVKITVFFYAGVSGAAAALGIRKDAHRLILILALGAAVLTGSIRMATSFIEHIHIGLKWVPIYLHWPMQTIISLILVAVAWLRQKKHTSGS